MSPLRILLLFIALGLVIGAPLEVQAHSGLPEEIARLNAEVRARPRDASLRLERAFAQRAHERPKAALRDLKVAARFAPSDAQIQRELARQLSRMGQPRKANRVITRALKLDRPPASATLWLAGRIAWRLRQPQRALLSYQAALEAAVAVGAAGRPALELFLELSELQESLGLLEAAAASLDRGIEVLGGAVVLRRTRMDLARRQGSTEVALAQIGALAERSRVKSAWWLLEAEVLREAGHEDAARRSLRRALVEADAQVARRPAVAPLLLRARVRAALADRQGAIQDLRLALRRDPQHRPARDFLIGLGEDP